MGERFCPKCGAYWQCGCLLEEVSYLPRPGCEHDWVEAVAVEVEDDLLPENAGVLVCRLCGLYAVKETADR
jgi:hypothetical protein